MSDETTVTPYDTGARCAPRLWQPDWAAVESAMRHDDEVDDIGNVDFDDEQGETVATIHVSGNDDGTWTVHVIPFVDEGDLEVEWHHEQ